jgi:phosphoribosylaminoimidazole carboxylase
LSGGQLGRMMAVAGHNINVEVIPLDPKGSASPAGQVSLDVVEGSFKDEEKIKLLAEKMVQPSDTSKRVKRVMTVEIEHVNCDAMDAVQKSKNIPIYPSPATVRLIQDKYVQKDHMRKSAFAIPTSNFEIINNIDDGKAFGTKYGFPFMLKARTGAYDGKGNYAVKNMQDVENGINALSRFWIYRGINCIIPTT